MIKFVGLLLFMAFPSWALVPVEGILRGEAELSYQQDPLRFIFPLFHEQKGEEARKLKFYHHRYQQGEFLNASCSYYGPINYGDSWRDDQAKRSVISTLQYIGLDTSIKAIGAYARELSVDEQSYEVLSENIVNNYCSKNLTVFALKTVKSALKHYYQNPQSSLIPRIETSPYATDLFKNSSGGPQARNHEFEYAIELFRDFCSWGGEMHDYRMMGPYLSNRFIMSFVFESLTSQKQAWDDVTSKVTLETDTNTLKVNCDQLICRKVDTITFSKKFPLSVGSSGLKSDLEKLYCQHFRYQDYKSDTIVQVKEWIKQQSLESVVFRQNFMISLMTGVPDPFFGMGDYKELPFIAKSSIDERWSKWAKEVLMVFSKDLLFEESLKINVKPKSDYVSLVTQGYTLDLSLTLGEMDRMLGESDKLKMFFKIKLPQTYLVWLRKEWVANMKEADYEAQKNIIKHLENTLKSAFKPKEDYYLQKIWNDQLFRLMAEELITQVSKAPLSWFEKQFENTMVPIPVTFHYGLFALGYLHNRAEAIAAKNNLPIND